jgi:isoquinoline 1-oxidoreductase alpha subunit
MDINQVARPTKSPVNRSANNSITLTINGVAKSVAASSADMPLLWALRDQLGLTGTKYGCGVEICGACMVLVNGKAEKSCDMSIGEAAGKRIVTIEGIAADPQGKLVQAAWIAQQVPQCGFCQSGMIIAATAALTAGKHGAAIASSIDNLCVCGTYQRILAAVSTL